MPDTRDPEDRQIRLILLSAAVAAVVGVLVAGIVLTVMISTNFNILNWME